MESITNKTLRWNHIKIIDFSIEDDTLINSDNMNSYVLPMQPKFGVISFNEKVIYEFLMTLLVFCESRSFP